MHFDLPNATFFAVVILGPLIVVLPIYRFLRTGWAAKRGEIIDGFDEAASGKHFRMFEPANLEAQEDPCGALDRMYRQSYGRRLFAWPVALLLGVSLVASLVGATSACRLVNWHEPGFPLIAIPRTALAALAGAYIFVVHDFISHARRLDFMPSDVHWGTLRLTAAIPIGYSFAAIPPDILGMADFIAFAAAAFPLETIQRMARKQFPYLSGASDRNNPNDDDIIRIQGINTDIATRLAHEDVSTITQMACCDPIRLTMRSGLTFMFVVDCMSQALAWEYLEKDMEILRRYGLRGAVEINHLVKQLTSADDDAGTKAECVLRQIIETLNACRTTTQSTDTMRFVLQEVATDPFTSYIESVRCADRATRSPAA